MRRRSSGFTLLEIMIAVAVFAVASAALIKNAALSVRQTGVIKDRTVAFWIAENQVAQLRAAPREADSFPSPGTSRAAVTMANRDWEVTVEVDDTENKDMRRIIVSVFRDDDPDAAIAVLTSFVGRY